MYLRSGYDNYKYICPSRGAARYTSQLLTTIKRRIDNNMLIVGDLHSPLSAIDRSPKQESAKKQELWMPYSTSWTSLVYIEHYTPEPKNTHSILMPMAHSQE